MYVKIGTYGQERLALHANLTIRGGKTTDQKRAIRGATALWISQTISGGRTTRHTVIALTAKVEHVWSMLGLVTARLLNPTGYSLVKLYLT